MIGQRLLQSRFTNLMKKNKVPRFIILVGEYGSGRKTFAKWLADEMSLLYVVADISADGVRNVIEQSYKVDVPTMYVFAEGQNMSLAAVSALLKITEEPPKEAYFVLTVQDEQRVLETLTSRGSIFHMDMYTTAEKLEFSGQTDDGDLFANYCNNGYEVSLLKQYGALEFYDFVNLVMDNIAEVSGSNALKMENRIAFKEGDPGYSVKLFWQAFRTECMKRMMEDTSNRLLLSEWIKITSGKLQELQIVGVNKQAVFDMWVFDIRKAAM